MGETIYGGETLTVVLRCRDRAGEPVDMASKAVDVVMTDRRERVLFRYSTHDEESKPLAVEGHFVLCRLESKDMSRLQGVYLVEIRIGGDGMVQVAQVPGVRILDSVTGKGL